MYKIGLWETEITPPLGAGIPGYCNLRFGCGVKDRLYSKAVVIDDGKEVAILISIDNCLGYDKMYDGVVERIQRYIPISEKSVMVAMTHTHTGGPDEEYPADGNDVELDKQYIDYMIKMSADCAVYAYQARENAKIRYAEGEVKGISFVRNYIMKDGSVRTNPGRLNPDIVKPYSEADYSLPMLFIENEKGELLGLIYDFACHQDCVDGSLYSGDYSSVVAKDLKEKYGKDFISVYYSGTAGNINHFNVNTAGDSDDHYVKMGLKIADEIKKYENKGEYIEGEIKTAKRSYTVKRRVPTSAEKAELERLVRETVVPEGLKLDASSPKELFDYFIAYRTLLMLSVSPDTIRVTVQAIKIGDFTMIALPGEIFAQYGERIRECKVSDKLMLVTHANSEWSYVPVPELYDTEIYEAKYSSAWFYPDDSVNITENAIKLAKELN